MRIQLNGRYIEEIFGGNNINLSPITQEKYLYISKKEKRKIIKITKTPKTPVPDEVL